MESDTNRRQWVLTALDKFESRLLRYAQRLLGGCGAGGADEARDVVQFVFLRLCDQSPEKIGDRLAQWLYTVCRNRAMDVLRTSGREKVNGHGRVAVFCEAKHGAAPQADPADSAEQTELHALVRALIEHLPANQREAIDLWADGFSYQQIAEITSQKEGHVRVLVHRGLKALREDPQVRALMNDEAPTRRMNDRSSRGAATCR
jgi:RNA polymerase sigma-70 factor (ECF subfamily)